MENRINETISCAQNSPFNAPSLADMMIASIISTAASVKMVPPTVMAIAWFFETPIRLTIGYETKVCVETYLP